MNDITVEELKQRLDNNEQLNIIDVREPWEYEEANIGAKLVPLGSIPKQIDELESLKAAEVIVHCKSGRRSAQAQKYLKGQGFANVRNLTGGIDAYLKQ